MGHSRGENPHLIVKGAWYIVFALHQTDSFLFAWVFFLPISPIFVLRVWYLLSLVSLAFRLRSHLRPSQPPLLPPFLSVSPPPPLLPTTFPSTPPPTITLYEDLIMGKQISALAVYSNFLFQCWGWKNWCFYSGRCNVGADKTRKDGGHIRSCDMPAGTEKLYGADRGPVHFHTWRIAGSSHLREYRSSST